MRYFILGLIVNSLLLRQVTCFIIGALSSNNGLGNNNTYFNSNVTQNARLQRTIIDLKKEEIVSHLLQNGGQGKEVQGPSMEFMLRVFEDLLLGKELADAVGLTDGRTRPGVLHSDTMRSISSTKKDVLDSYYFEIPTLPKHEHLKMAEIRFLGNQDIRRRYKFTLFVRRDGQTIDKIKFSHKSRTGDDSDIVFDVTDQLFSVINRFHGNITIELRNRKKGNSFDINNINGDPILVLFSQDKEFLKTVLESFASKEKVSVEGTMNLNSRKKRSTDTKISRKKGRKRKKDKWRTGNSSEAEICKMHNFKVDFDLIGWGPWIIHPKTFNAKVCFGQCPSPIGHEYTPTNHAMLQTLMRMKRPLSAPEPCCVPTKLRPLSMLYYEYDAIVVRHHQDMVAAECGCR